MLRGWFLAVCAGLLWTSAAPAQAPVWQFRWQPGQVLTYRVQHVISVLEEAYGTKEETTQKHTLTKRWQVLSVDGTGIATVQKTLTALRIERTTANGEVLLFDSANLDKSNPQMREQLAKFVGQPLEVLRIDQRGKVVEVKACPPHFSASRFESELPFVLTLPDQGPTVGQTWERAYAITMEPPQGVNEKYQASQKYGCKAAANGLATISLTTVLHTQPAAVADRVPLLPLQPEGEVVFDVQNGRVQSARLQITKELKDYQGEGSNYRFKSEYTEEYAGNQ